MDYKNMMSKLNGTLNTIDTVYSEIAKKHGMTFNSLMTICLIEEAESITQKQIGDILHLPKSTVHSILVEFIKKDYLFLKEGSNKKEKLVDFTNSGKRFFQPIILETARFEERILTQLGDENCELLLQMAEKLNEIVSIELDKIEGE
ncbi:MarR family winged helix-turn-helix transcriptional regulator [Enterococcus villorum]|uniref:HTH marR-type domain-containing protein n=2 Tax=Enterococcus villorum TaxID=112904 RepID=A0A511J5A7_9ENTE|nr:MarR family transcriptional regulator [Enterococcus villorum]EOH85875.1 hypothetical protein UAO_02770 [Enterococcus villorum ATCC 700913]EOW78546.1 hypothetical protein I591_00085 [Enterococcus villorum ATCC 700913]GEL93196.1 hypothetical protein EVI01_25330 [Enterococcus villorum]